MIFCVLDEGLHNLLTDVIQYILTDTMLFYFDKHEKNPKLYRLMRIVCSRPCLINGITLQSAFFTPDKLQFRNERRINFSILDRCFSIIAKSIEYAECLLILQTLDKQVAYAIILLINARKTLKNEFLSVLRTITSFKLPIETYKFSYENYDYCFNIIGSSAMWFMWSKEHYWAQSCFYNAKFFFEEHPEFYPYKIVGYMINDESVYLVSILNDEFAGKWNEIHQIFGQYSALTKYICGKTSSTSKHYFVFKSDVNIYKIKV